jgi:hypothetical protein
MELLDPWLDAEKIARRLKTQNNTLHAAVGTEALCIKCAILRQVWNDHVTALPADNSQVWIWFDADEHMEFLGDYVPVDPPVYIRYENSARTVIASLKGIASDGLEIEERDEKQTAPNLHALLINNNWSV